MKNLSILTGIIMHRIFKIILNISFLNKHGEKTNNPSIRIYVSKIGLHLE